MKNYNSQNNIDNTDNLVKQFTRLFNFWPFFLVSIILSLSISYIYLRYVDFEFKSQARIEIIDKAQDSEMALPTAMTVFNRSMINLDNEIGVLNSFSLHKRSVSSLRSNIKYYSIGRIKTSETHISEWYDDFDLIFNIDTDSITQKQSYIISSDKSNLYIDKYNSNDELLKSFTFDGLTTKTDKNELPFSLEIRQDSKPEINRMISFFPYNETVDTYRSIVKVNESSPNSDQLDLSITYPNKLIGNDYLNSLISEFDKDGIKDRQLEYQRTIQFVDSRSGFLALELEKIEKRKEEFKKEKKLSDIKYDASINANQKFEYSSEIFTSRSQKELVLLLKEGLENKSFQLMPVNIGIDNPNLNLLISEYNLILKERDKYLLSAGANNSFVKNLEKQLSDYSKNITISVNNYLNSLEIIISNLESKEKEYSAIYEDIPEIEKILRSIERELEVKESLFLLLLQKKGGSFYQLCRCKTFYKNYR